MSIPYRYLPPEILDQIFDLLHDERDTLKKCSLVSKSWVPHTRRQLFAEIKIRSVGDLELWKKLFPDVTNSPAYHTRSLFIGCPHFAALIDAEDGGWIQAFSGVTCLDLDNGTWPFNTLRSPLTPFCKFTSTLKSFRISFVFFPYPQLFDLIHSLPLLEDLSLTGQGRLLRNDDNPHRPQAVIPSTLPPLTGDLDLFVRGGMENALHQLQDPPNGLHFRKVTLLWEVKEEYRWITELVKECSRTLESLDIARNSYASTSI